MDTVLGACGGCTADKMKRYTGNNGSLDASSLQDEDPETLGTVLVAPVDGEGEAGGRKGID